MEKISDIHGIGALRHPLTCKEHTAEERYYLVARVLAGESQKSVAISAGIDSGLLSKWVQIYKMKGYDGLYLRKGRRSKESIVKNDNTAQEYKLKHVCFDSVKNQNLMDEIKKIFDDNKHRYGVRRVYQELLNRGYTVNHKKVQR